MRRWIAAAALLCALGTVASVARAQNTSVQGSITAAAGSCLSNNCVYYQLPPNTPWVMTTIAGTWSGTVNIVLITAPNATYANLNTVPWTTVATVMAGGSWSVSAAGATFVLVEASAWTSGTARVTMAESQTGAPMVNPIFPGKMTGAGLQAAAGGVSSNCWNTNGGTTICGGSAPASPSGSIQYNNGGNLGGYGLLSATTVEFPGQMEINSGLDLGSLQAIQSGTGPVHSEDFNFADGTVMNGKPMSDGTGTIWQESGGRAVVNGTLMVYNGGYTGVGTIPPFYASYYNQDPVTGAHECDNTNLPTSAAQCDTTGVVSYVVAPPPVIAGGWSSSTLTATYIAQNDDLIVDGAVHFNMGACLWSITLRVGTTFYPVDQGNYPCSSSFVPLDGKATLGAGLKISVPNQTVAITLATGEVRTYQGNDPTAPACINGAAPNAQPPGCYSANIAAYLCLSCSIHPSAWTWEEGPKLGGAPLYLKSVASGGTNQAQMFAGQGGATQIAATTGNEGQGAAANVKFGPITIPDATQLLNVTGASGGTITGATSCQMTGFNGGGSGAVVYVVFPTTGSWSGALFYTQNPGSGYGSAPTTATLSSPCSGTASVVTTEGGPGSYQIGACSAQPYDGFDMTSQDLSIDANASTSAQITHLNFTTQNTGTPQVFSATGNWFGSQVITGGYVSNAGTGSGSTGCALIITTGSPNTNNPVVLNITGRGLVGFAGVFASGAPNLVNTNTGPGGAQWLIQANAVPFSGGGTATQAFTVSALAPNFSSTMSGCTGNYCSVFGTTSVGCGGNCFSIQAIVNANTGLGNENLYFTALGTNAGCSITNAYADKTGVISKVQCSWQAGSPFARIDFYQASAAASVALSGTITGQYTALTPVVEGSGGSGAPLSGGSQTVVLPVGAPTIPLTQLATQAADTVVMNAGGGVTAPTAVAMPANCGTSINYSNTSHGYNCTAKTNPITTATGGSGTGTPVCLTATCTNNSGSYSVPGGTFVTGNLLVLVWPTTTTAYKCWATQNYNGATTNFDIGHSVATATA